MENHSSPFQSVRPQRAVDAIIEQIRGRLKSNELQAGQRLPSERDLANQLEVSRNTVREAIRMLEVSGLVTLKKGATGGAFLNASNTAALTQNLLDGIALKQYSFQELIDIRLILENYLVEQACEHASDEDIEDLAAIAQESREADSQLRDWEGRLVLHMDFHRKLSRIAHNSIAEVLTGPLLEITHRFHLEAGPSGRPEPHEYRTQLVEALRSRDSEEGQKAMTKHLEFLRQQNPPGAEAGTPPPQSGADQEPRESAR